VSEKLGTPTVVGNPFGQMKMSSRAKTQLASHEPSALLIACGLALRSFD
jgi:type IV pilus assembly protein PilM